MTPDVYQDKDATLTYTITHSLLGYVLLAATSKGVCLIRLGDNQKKLEAELKKDFAASDLIRDDAAFKKWTPALVDYISGNKPCPALPMDVGATAFQRQVWDCLRTIPSGTTLTYSQVAQAIGRPTAVRAVANACANNPLALIVPCHRIIPKSGGMGGYRWDPKRKHKLLKMESRNQMY